MSLVELSHAAFDLLWDPNVIMLVSLLVGGLTLGYLIFNSKFASPLDLYTPANAATRFQQDRDRALVQMAHEAKDGSTNLQYTINYDGEMATWDPPLVDQLVMEPQNYEPRSIFYLLLGKFLPYANGLLFSANQDWERQHEMLRRVFQPGNFRGLPQVAIEQTEDVCQVLSPNSPYSDAARDYQEQMEEIEKAGKPRVAPYDPETWKDEPVGVSGLYDLWTTLRFCAIRFFVHWAYGVDPNEKLGRLLARQTDWYSRVGIDILTTLENPLDIMKYYCKLWTVAKGIKEGVREIVEQELYEEDPNKPGYSVGGGAYPNFVSTMVANECSVDEITSQINHVQGAHKAVALETTLILFELEKAPGYKTAVRNELEEVYGSGDRVPSGKDMNSRDLPVTYKVFQETLRLHPATLAVHRTTGEETLIRGELIPKGTEILVWIQALHEHEDFWNQPQLFNPTRWDQNPGRLHTRSTYMPFLEGTRNCAGYSLAHMECLCMLYVMLVKHNVAVEREEITKTANFFTGIEESIPFTLNYDS